MHTVRLQYSTRPRMLPIYAGGLLVKRSGLAPRQALPLMRSEWRDFRIDTQHLRRFMRACRLSPTDTMPLVYPLVFMFPLHLSIVGHRKFPLLYVRMMQIRNHVLQHRPIDLRETVNISAEIVGQRVVAKGLEMDMYSALQASDGLVWESLHTYFFPGNFGEADPVSPLAQLPAISEPSEETTWTMPRGGGFCFGLMAGDYNAIHYLASYARRMGYKRAFAHSQLSLALCMRNLPPFEQDRPIRLDVAIKGPVYYGGKVSMKHAEQGRGHRFDLYCEDNPRPCMSGLLDSAEPDLDDIRNTYALLGCHESEA